MWPYRTVPWPGNRAVRAVWRFHHRRTVMVFWSLIMSVMIAIVLVGCRAAEAGITMMAVSGRAVKTMVARMFLVVIVGPVVFRTVLVAVSYTHLRAHETSV